MSKTIPPYLNILFVDDDTDDHEFFLEAVTKAKTSTHVKIRTVREGNEITKALMNGYGRLPDIIFLDINLPGKNGHEILEEIRCQKKLKDVAVAIFTTSSTDYDIHKAHRCGANLYIKKPGDISELIAIIEKVFTLNWKKHTPHSTLDKFVWKKKTISEK